MLFLMASSWWYLTDDGLVMLLLMNKCENRWKTNLSSLLPGTRKMYLSFEINFLIKAKRFLSHPPPHQQTVSLMFLCTPVYRILPPFHLIPFFGFDALWYWINSAKNIFMFATPHFPLHAVYASHAHRNMSSRKICNFLEWSQALHPLTLDMTWLQGKKKMSNI